MESLHRLGDEFADLGAGTSPVRGVAVVAAAFALGLSILAVGFDGRRNLVDGQTGDPSAAPSESGTEAMAGPTGSEQSDGSDIDVGTAILPAEGAGEVVADTTSTTGLAARPVSDVTILVVNSKAPKGSAAQLTAKLVEKGYQTKSPANADRSVASAVYYLDGFGVEAQALAASLNVGSEFVVALDLTASPVNDMREADILVVVAPGGPLSPT